MADYVPAALRVRLGLLLALFAALAGCGREGLLPPLQPDAVILAFGNSLTYGSGANREESYPAVLQRLSGRTVINAGIPGELSAQGAERLPDLLQQHRPALVILCHGGNDLLRKRDAEALAQNLRRMIEAARAQGSAVVLLAVPEPGLFPSAPALYAELAREYGIPIDRDTIATIERDPALKSDAIHPNAAGYRKIAEAVYALLKENGAL